MYVTHIITLVAQCHASYCHYHLTIIIVYIFYANFVLNVNILVVYFLVYLTSTVVAFVAVRFATPLQQSAVISVLQSAVLSRVSCTLSLHSVVTFICSANSDG